MSRTDKKTEKRMTDSLTVKKTAGRTEEKTAKKTAERTEEKAAKKAVGKRQDRHSRNSLNIWICFALAAFLLACALFVPKGSDSPKGEKKETASKKETGNGNASSSPYRRRPAQEATTEDPFPAWYHPEDAREATTEEVEADLFTVEDFFDSLEEMGREIQAAGLAYKGSAGHKTFAEATSFNCALYVSWTLQEMGLIPEGKTFWLNHDCHGSAYKYIEKHPELFEVYHPNTSVVNCSFLKPGDICGFEINGYAAHTAVYAGTDKKGHMVWYSAGRTDFRKMAKKDFKPVRFKYYEQNNDILYTIVRIKYEEKEKK